MGAHLQHFTLTFPKSDNNTKKKTEFNSIEQSVTLTMRKSSKQSATLNNDKISKTNATLNKDNIS
jgi:hypothetical protein